MVCAPEFLPLAPRSRPHPVASQHITGQSFHSYPYGCSSGSSLSGEGAGNACRNAYTSATSLSDITFALYGGISPLGERTYLRNAWNGIGLGPSLGPWVPPCPCSLWH